MKLLLFVIVAMVPCLGLQQAKPPEASQPRESESQFLYGTWYPYPPGDAKSDSIREQFRHNRATDKDELVLTHLCPGDYRAAIAKVVSPVEITESTIRVLKKASATEKGEMNAECHVSLEPGLWSYSLSDEHNRLTITNPGGHPDVMEFARQDTATATALPSNLYGTWALPIHDDRDTKVQIRLIFYGSADPSKGTVRQIATCMKGNNTLVSQVDTAISVTPENIRILDSASHVQRDGPFTCAVNFTSGTMRYVLAPSGNTMTLTNSAGQSIKLTRAQADGLN